MLDKYLYTGSDEIDNYTLSLRRQGYTAYVESNDSEVYLVTDYIVNSISFQYIGKIRS